jgi:hypothetical protein
LHCCVVAVTYRCVKRSGNPPDFFRIPEAFWAFNLRGECAPPFPPTFFNRFWEAEGHLKSLESTGEIRANYLKFWIANPAEDFVSFEPCAM